MNLRRESGFCWDCGSVVHYMNMENVVHCFVCKRKYGNEIWENYSCSYNVNFNTYDKTLLIKSSGADNEGPIVERNCPQCNNDKMTYATLQLRSADEGQTVFYTCTECGHKETENS